MKWRKPGGMNRREAKVLLALVELHGEYGDEKDFTRAVVEYVVGDECAGSLAGLAMLGFATQRSNEEGLVYALTRAGRQAADLIVKGRKPVRVNGHDRTRR